MQPAVRPLLRKAWGLAAAFAVVWSATATGAAMAAAPPAGTVIEAHAEATFFDTDSGYHARLRSNTVRAVVQGVEALSLSPAHALQAAVGGHVVLPHRVSNTGNMPLRFTVAAANMPHDAFDVLAVSIVNDLNGNGQADPGEPILAPSDVLGPVAPGDAVDLVLLARLPTTATAGQTAQLQLTAQGLAQGIVAQVADRISVGEGALLQVVKSVSAEAATPAAGRCRWTRSPR
jgi:large repetitive protein